MANAKDYELDPLIEAVTSIDWNMDHAGLAIKAIQETVRRMTGDELSDVDAHQMLRRLLDRNLIRPKIAPPVSNVLETGAVIGPARAVKYFRVPEDER